MIKKVLVINGGGRPHGNTAQLINSFVKGVTEAGHKAEVISLVKNEVKPCLGCFVCQTGQPCVQKDSFNSMVPKIKEADLLVLASPLYYFAVNARIKAFIERLFSIESKYPRDKANKDPKAPTKDIALLITAGDSCNFKKNFDCLNLYYEICFLDWLKFNGKGILLARGCIDDGKTTGIEKTGFLEKAYEFGKKIY